MIQLNELSHRYGEQIIFNQANFTLEAGEKACLIGRNGAGKSTLMDIINGEIQADSVDTHIMSDMRVSKLNQQLPSDLNITVREFVYQGLAKQLKLIEQFNQLSQQTQQSSKSHLKQIEHLQTQIDAAGAWDIDHQVQSVITQMQLASDATLSQLSGGWQRRAELAKALVSNPHLLLLDEPTNHLDLNAISWLEKRVQSWQGTVLFITHDRSFLQNIATRIIEIDRTKIFSWQGNYQFYLKNKEIANNAEDKQNQLFDKKLQQEEIWIRQGIKARRTRNEGRVRALEDMREQMTSRIKRQKQARIAAQTVESSGKKVIEAYKINKTINDICLLNQFSLKIVRGDRIGIIGNNGVGKTTLLKILLQKIPPDSGTIKVGTNLTIGYFDQIRRDLEIDKTVAYNVAQGSDYLMFNNKPQHVIGYLKNFLFTPKRSMTKVSALSGGERNRVALAKLFSESTNLLILDEPTNDLDVEMLEALEQTLLDYQGTILLVSHDRAFLDNVVTQVLVFESDNKVTQYYGGYNDWLKRGKQLQGNQHNEGETNKQQVPKKNSKSPIKLSYKLQRELDNLPNEIENLEHQLEPLQQKISDSEFYNQDYDQQNKILSQISQLQQQLDKKNERWLQLEESTVNN